ncbi:hypothetical protein V1509DRAFT_636479 [Lipomyces kononenkoae]
MRLNLTTENCFNYILSYTTSIIASMESSEVSPQGSQYSQKCSSCRTLLCCATLEDLHGLFMCKGGKSVKSCKHCRDNASTSTDIVVIRTLQR